MPHCRQGRSHRITGVRVREIVRDAFLDRADEVIKVNVTLVELRNRLREGKIYKPEVSRRYREQFTQRERTHALIFQRD